MNTQTEVRFMLGQVVSTPGALEALGRNNTTGLDYVQRHATGDWGEVCPEDEETNNQAIETGERILSAYTLTDGTKLWIITDAAIDAEGNRQATTILLPEEY